MFVWHLCNSLRDSGFLFAKSHQKCEHTNMTTTFNIDMKNILLSVILAALPLSALALTQDDVNFAQRQCQQKNDPAKCRVARDMMRTYQMEKRDKLEHDAAVRSGRPMNGSVNVIIDADPYPGYKGEYRWNHNRGKYCYHNKNGSVRSCN